MLALTGSIWQQKQSYLGNQIKWEQNKKKLETRRSALKKQTFSVSYWCLINAWFLVVCMYWMVKDVCKKRTARGSHLLWWRWDRQEIVLDAYKINREDSSRIPRLPVDYHRLSQSVQAFYIVLHLLVSSKFCGQQVFLIQGYLCSICNHRWVCFIVDLHFLIMYRNEYMLDLTIEACYS